MQFLSVVGLEFVCTPLPSPSHPSQSYLLSRSAITERKYRPKKRRTALVDSPLIKKKKGILFRFSVHSLGVSVVARHVVQAVVASMLALISGHWCAVVGSIPDVFAVLGAAKSHFRHWLGSDFEIERSSGENGTTVASEGRLSILSRRRAFPLGPAEVVEVLKVPFGNRRLVGTAEYANLKVLDQTVGRGLGTRFLKGVEVLVDDLVGVDVLCNVFSGLFVGNELLRAGQVNAVLGFVSKTVLKLKTLSNLQCADA